MITIKQVKKLRQETGISITECKKALEEANGDLEKAKQILRKKGKDFAIKRSGKETGEGIIESYIHPNKKIGVLLNLGCESDFVARSSGFQELAHELCLHITAMDPEEKSLLSESWIKDESKTIKNLIEEYITKIGENITVKNFIRYEIQNTTC